MRWRASRSRASSPPGAKGPGFLPSLIGSNRALLARFRKLLTQNNYAFTYASTTTELRESLTGIEETI